MAVLRPLKVVLTNYPEEVSEDVTAVNHPNNPELGTRQMSFGRELYIEKSDFMEDPPKKFFRLRPGGEVRLRFAYIIRCDEVVRDDDGNVVELRCTYDPDTRSGSGSSDKKVKGTIHWASAADAVAAEVRLYDRLFTHPEPGSSDAFLSHLNPLSLETVHAMVEPSIANMSSGCACQFERLGYFCADPADHEPGRPVLNRIVTLRDTWAKIEAR
jgi:glutaminyl-tRNA synthetase